LRAHAGDVIKLLDFGLARGTEIVGDAATTSMVMMGTPDYVAPEQAFDASTADIRADLYGLGCTLFHLLTGQTPFPGGSALSKSLRHQQELPRPIQPLRPEVPAALNRLVQRLLAKRPADRHQTPAEAAAELAPFCHAEPVREPDRHVQPGP